MHDDSFGWKRAVFAAVFLALVGVLLFGVYRYFANEVEAQQREIDQRTDKKNFQHIRRTIQDAADRTMPKDFDPFKSPSTR